MTKATALSTILHVVIKESLSLKAMGESQPHDVGVFKNSQQNLCTP